MSFGRPLGQCCRYCRQHCTGLALRTPGSPLRCLRQAKGPGVPIAVYDLRARRGPRSNVGRAQLHARTRAHEVAEQRLPRHTRSPAAPQSCARCAWPRHTEPSERAGLPRSASPVQCCRQDRQHWPSGRAEGQPGSGALGARSPLGPLRTRELAHPGPRSAFRRRFRIQSRQRPSDFRHLRLQLRIGILPQVDEFGVIRRGLLPIAARFI